ncbi:MAG: amidohydrolase family protein [Armatimonadota bacterium]
MSEQQYYDQLMDLLSGLEIIDTHEHLPSEAERIGQPRDFSHLFSHYCISDLGAAGMTAKEMGRFFDAKTPLDEKWQLFQPYYHLIQDGSYCRAAHLAMEQFYGISCLESLADCEQLTAKMAAANVAGLYRKVLKDICRIRVSMNFGSSGDEPEFFATVPFVHEYVEVTKGVIRGLEDEIGTSCATLTAFVEAVREKLRRSKQHGIRGIKFALAYNRNLHFAPRTLAEAEPLFNRVMEEGYGWRPHTLGWEEMRPLTDFMVHRLCEMAGELELPVIFHTGMQAHHEHNPDDTRPLRLWNLPHRYRKTDFILLHAGFPWMSDAGMLAKQYPNVYLDMAWTHLMSPEISTRALLEWIDLVPMHKIFGFGGDYCVVEKVYGHLVLARRDIARAFAVKMARDGMPLSRAQAWLQAMLFDNPNRVYRLELKEGVRA